MWARFPTKPPRPPENAASARVDGGVSLPNLLEEIPIFLFDLCISLREIGISLFHLHIFPRELPKSAREIGKWKRKIP